MYNLLIDVYLHSRLILFIMNSKTLGVRGIMMYYPLFFKPVYKEIIWGGRNLESAFGRELPPGNIAESWEVCCHKNGTSVISEGTLSGKSLTELMKEDKLGILGSKNLYLDRFPLLIKFLDANDKLSVQVHPDNEYSLRVEGDLGKAEMWYILDARPDARLIYGTKPGVAREDFEKAAIRGNLEDCLNFVPVKKGDTIYIPAGTLHAILDGIILAEIQQNSDTTYRIYDWNRVDKNGKSRELHISKALDVINFDFKGEITTPVHHNHNGYSSSTLVSCEFFTVKKIDISTEYADRTKGDTFFIFTSTSGSGKVVHNKGEYVIKSGTTFLIPASMGEFKIIGELTLLKSYL